MVATWDEEFPLIGAGGEPIDLVRTIVSHGLASLPPMAVDETSRRFGVTLAVPGERPRTVTVSPGSARYARLSVAGASPPATTAALRRQIRHMFRLDDDLTSFSAPAVNDADLAWVTTGAGRLIRSPTVFKDVVKTICPTNCAWSATRRMVTAPVANLGAAAADAAPASAHGRAFPTPERMAEAPEEFYRDVVRAGYRGRYLRQLAPAVTTGDLDLDELASAAGTTLDDEAFSKRLLALPGVGPYAAAHIMLILGLASRLVLDSWTRPTYARLTGSAPVPDAAITARFAV